MGAYNLLARIVHRVTFDFFLLKGENLQMIVGSYLKFIVIQCRI